MHKLTTIVFVRRGNELLLGFKKRGFGAGRWDGFGGKVEPGETIEAGARRELLEESGLIAGQLAEVGHVYFDYETIPDKVESVVFLCDDFTGDIGETDEMRPQWFSIDALPYDTMWTDEKEWLPRILEGKKLDARFHYKDLVELREFTITERPNELG